MSVLFGRLLIFAVMLATVPFATPAHAAVYSFLASTPRGNANCEDAADACAFPTTAINSAGDGGVVNCVDSGGGFGPGQNSTTIISTSVTIECSQTGIFFGQIKIDAPGKTVVLRGVAINNYRYGTPALLIANATSVVVENSSIGNPGSGSCISDQRTGPGTLFLKNTSVYNCPGVGILVAPSGGSTIGATLENVQVRNSQYGLAVGAGGRVMIEHSAFSGNSTAGVEADAGGFVGLDSSLVSNNGIGVQAGGTIAISNSDIKSNNTGVSGNWQSYGNNRFFANASSDGTPPTPVGQK